MIRPKKESGNSSSNISNWIIKNSMNDIWAISVEHVKTYFEKADQKE